MKARQKMKDAMAYAGGKSNVMREAKMGGKSAVTNNETAAEMKKKAAFKPYKKGGKAPMKEVMADGAKAMSRLDKPRRATGGRVGSDKSPFSSAHKAGAPERD